MAWTLGLSADTSGVFPKLGTAARIGDRLGQAGFEGVAGDEKP